jgi:predicted adenine nucleotide alpha hydrolase (AANH) superfamily ATPase
MEATKEYKDEPERGKRCSICFEFRLKKVMEYAKELGIKKVASVLGESRWKDLNQVNEAGKKASDSVGVEYVLIEGRKGGMQEKRLQLIKELELYNQEYCGCIYSIRK